MARYSFKKNFTLQTTMNTYQNRQPQHFPMMGQWFTMAASIQQRAPVPQGWQDIGASVKAWKASMRDGGPQRYSGPLRSLGGGG